MTRKRRRIHRDDHYFFAFFSEKTGKSLNLLNKPIDFKLENALLAPKWTPFLRVFREFQLIKLNSCSKFKEIRVFPLENAKK